MLVKVKSPFVNKPVATYCIVDEESNSSYIHPTLLDQLRVKSEVHDYSVQTLSGHSTKLRGRIAQGLTIKGFRTSTVYKLPELYEAEFIPDSRDEVATKEAVSKLSDPKVRHFQDKFINLKKDAQVYLLLGRNNPKLISTRTYTETAPVVHQTPLGWALVGEAEPTLEQGTQINRTLVATKESFSSQREFPDSGIVGALPEYNPPIFQEFPDDESPGFSQEDQKFLDLMKDTMRVNEEGHIEAPLPFKSPNPRMPDNSRPVFQRTANTLKRLRRDKDLFQFCIESMGKNISQRYVEVVPEEELVVEDGRAWYIPVFVALSKRKKPRLVFDSAASYGNTCLNAQLMSGPDTNNRLRDVLLRFREDRVGFIADVEAMFLQFHVDSSHKDYMRFYWFKDNDPNQPLIAYRARVHIFGNTCSPSVADTGLKLTIDISKKSPSSMVKKYLRTGFYVDDGCSSAPDADTAIHIIKGAQKVLSEFGIRLHKVIASDAKVLNAFDDTERAKDLQVIEFEEAPMQSTLGCAWDITRDVFIIRVDIPDRDFTKRGILSVCNSVFDPIGMASPCSLAGRLFQRKILPKKGHGDPEVHKLGWDDPLPESYKRQWDEFKRGLPKLRELSMPRCLIPPRFGTVVKQELYSFSDASEDAIGHVMYMRSQDDKGKVHVAFVNASSKVAPQSATSIPRLELCAALQAALATQEICAGLTHKPVACHYYSDSKVVLGYLENKEKRFSNYVTRRVNLILKLSNNWKFISTQDNPADIASRAATPEQLIKSKWLTGPEFLWLPNDQHPDTLTHIPMEDLPEQVVEKRVLVTRRPKGGLFSSVFTRVSSWDKMVRIAELVKDFLQKNFKFKETLSGKEILIRDAQRGALSDIISTLNRGDTIAENHPLEGLAPVLTSEGILRVGGRLERAKFPFDQKHPYLIPKDHPISKAILAHFHGKIGHQGRHMTHGAIRIEGFHLENGKREIRHYIKNCVMCRRLRGKLASQKMADLPIDRLESCPPFSYCGLDVAGPWKIKRGRFTRANPGSQKVWVLLFTCMASRAIHVEVLTSLDTPSFQNALTRFIAVRGTCTRFRSDQGRNFIGGAEKEEDIEGDVDLEELQASMKIRGIEWIFNPPNAPHFGGIWERKIQELKKVLSGTLLVLGPRELTYDEFQTFVVETSSIVNSTPLWEVSDDPNDPFPLTPSMLLTLRETPHPPLPDTFGKDDLLAYGKSRWRRVQYLADQFWVRWRKSYLQLLQTRSKWTKERENIKTGDIVLLRDKTETRNKWPLGRIVSVKKSQDNLVRSVEVKVFKHNDKKVMKAFTYVRPINEVVLLSSI